MKSSKELTIDTNLIEMVDELKLSGTAMTGLKLLLENEEIQALQEFANTVSIKRLGYNDHGPVHMRTVAQSAIKMLKLIKDAGIKTTLEADLCGVFEDSLLAVVLASMLHDIGMIMGRHSHEYHSTILANPIIEKILTEVYGNDIKKRVMVRAIALEGIAGHMGSINVSSLEAGIVQIADGCDMTKGRARIPIAMNNAPRVGHIHQYSANSIEEVCIKAGDEKPIHIDVHMSSEVGLFQIEEVLMHKIAASSAKQYIELYAKVENSTEKRYL